jgi:hypothetical protein
MPNMISDCPCRPGAGRGSLKAYCALGSAIKRPAMGFAVADGVAGWLATTVLDAENVHPTLPQRLN